MVDRQLAIVKQANALEVPEEEVRTMATSVLALFPKDATPEQARNVAKLAILYGLDPLADEIIPYRGKPYITIAGRLRKAHESGKFQGIIDDRPATEEEKRVHGVAAQDYFYYVSVKRSDWIRPNGRFGRFKATEPTVTGDPMLMARKRALRRALTEAFNMPLPGLYQDEHVETMEREPEAGTVIEMANQGQITAIHALKAQLKMTDEQYRGELQRFYCVDSSTKLTTFQADDLLSAWSDRAVEQQKEPLDEKTTAQFDGIYGTENTVQVHELRQPVLPTRPDAPRAQRPEPTRPDASPAKGPPTPYTHNPVCPRECGSTVWGWWCGLVETARGHRIQIWDFEPKDTRAVKEQGKALKDRIDMLEASLERERQAKVEPNDEPEDIGEPEMPVDVEQESFT